MFEMASSHEAMAHYQELKRKGKLNHSMRSAIVDHAHVLDTPKVPFSESMVALKSASPLEFVKDMFQQPSFNDAEDPFAWELYAKYSNGNGVAFALRTKDDRELKASMQLTESAEYTLHVCTTTAVAASFGKQAAASDMHLHQLQASDYNMQPFLAWNGAAWVELRNAKASGGYFWYKMHVTISGDDVGQHVLLKLAASEEFEAWFYV